MRYRLLFRIIVGLIRKYFPEGVGVITDGDENIVAYKWTWTKELENAVFKKSIRRYRR